MRLLSENDGGNVNIHNNIITLANQAGFETYWISNQGKIGIHDSSASRITIYADHTFFTKIGNYKFYNDNALLSDDVLLPEIEKIIKRPSAVAKLIILHIMGSYADIYKQINHKITINYINSELSCHALTYTVHFLLSEKELN